MLSLCKRTVWVVAVVVLGVYGLDAFAHGKKKHGSEAKPPPLKPVELYLPIMNAGRGKTLFIEKGCITCHPINGIGGGSIPLDVNAWEPRMNAFEFAARMFNHSVGMTAAQTEVFGAQITLTGMELADITAFTHDHEVQHSLSIKDIPRRIRKLMHH
jgi:mono/diheme cytochrome c family protein